MTKLNPDLASIAARDPDALAIADAILPPEIPGQSGMAAALRNIRRSERAYIVETLAARLGFDLSVAAEIVLGSRDDRTPSLFETEVAANADA